jgi:hypothetical protein
MTRRFLPVVLSMMLLGALLLEAGTGAEELPAAAANDGKIAVTRSDGSTGRTTPPDPKLISKLVGYMRDGMNRADRSERQQTKRVQNRRK